jgi:hypothetical protein
MKSVADQIAREAVEAVSTLTASERVSLALRLGEQAVEIYASANCVGQDEARRILRRNNQLGRRASVALSDDGA